MSIGVSDNQECARCAELEKRFLDPGTPNPGTFLYSWATHHLDDHRTTPRPRPGCDDCARFTAGPGPVRPDLWARWARTHYMTCALAPDWKRGQL